jgi:hypothetical protein
MIRQIDQRRLFESVKKHWKQSIMNGKSADGKRIWVTWPPALPILRGIVQNPIKILFYSLLDGELAGVV